jgi:hypothetical protein
MTAASGESSGYQGYYVTESSNSADTNRHSWKAFEGTTDNSTPDNAWAPDQATTTYNGTDYSYNGSFNLGTGAVNGEWIKLQLPNKIKLEYMKIWLKDNDSTRIPEDWRLYGSNDDTNWTELFFKTGQGAVNENLYTINATSMYKYLAVVVTKISGQNNYFRIVELEYWGIPEYDPDADGTDVIVRSVPNVPNTDWLEVYYDGRDFSGTPTSITDKSGNNITATANNITIDTTYQSFEFTQSPKSNIIADNVSFVSGDQPHSIALWFRLKNTNQHNLLFDYRVAGGSTTTGTATGLYIRNYNTNLQFFHQGTDKEINFDFIENTWYHLIGTYAGGGGYSGSTIYINGVDVGGSQAGANTVLDLPATGKITIGDYLYGVYGMGDGSIANFRLFNRALTGDEVWQLYAYQKEYFGHGNLGMTLKAGRLGIGTTEPRAVLDVRGPTKFSGTMSYSVPYYFARQANTGSYVYDEPIVYNNQVKTNYPNSFYYSASNNGYYQPPLPGVYQIHMTAIANGSGNIHIQKYNYINNTVLLNHDDTHFNFTSGGWESISASALILIDDPATQGIRIYGDGTGGNGIWAYGTYHGVVSIVWVSDI